MKKLFINALIIIVTSVLFNTVGISFRVFLSNKIGTEGIGLFQLIMSVYMMAILFVVNGVNVAVTRLVAEEGGRGSFSISRALIIKAVSFSFVFSVPAFVFLFFGADYIGAVWLGDQRTVFSLKLLAVGMPFAGVSSCVKGYFYAISKLIRPTIAQAVELVIQIFIIIHILDYFMLGGAEYACAAISVAITIAEIASCLYALTLYGFELRNNDKRISDIFYQTRILKKLLYIALPISISSLIRSSLRTMENLMIPIGLVKYGYTRKLSLEKYGQLHGMVMPILMFPSSIILAFSALLIPEVSEANALNQKKRVDYSVTRALQLTCIMSILISGLFIAFSQKLGLAIYDSTECGFLMKVLAPLIPLIYLDIVVDELLKGLNQQVSALGYNIFDAVIKIILIYYVLPIKGIEGLIIVMYICNLLNLTLSLHRLLVVTQLHFKTMDWILKPILSIASSGFMVIFLLDITGISFFTDIIYILIGAFSVGILYFIFLSAFGCLTIDDFKWFRSIFKYTASNNNINLNK